MQQTKLRVTKKGFTTTAATLRGAISFLKHSITSKNVSVIPSDLKKFMDEVETLKKEEQKTYSPVRAIKLYGLLRSFLKINTIEVDNHETEYVLEGLKSVARSESAIYYSKAFDKIYKIIATLPTRKFLDAELYFATKEDIKKITRIQKKLISLYANENEKRLYNFNSVVNLLNTESEAYHYKVRYRSKYQFISTPSALYKYVDSQYSINKNKQNKDLKELLSTHQFSDASRFDIETKHKAMQAKEKDEYEYLIAYLEKHQEEKNFDNLEIDIKIVGYEHSSLYPEIKFSTKDNVLHKPMHLRSEVINVLWYDPIQVQDGMKASEIIKNYNVAFANVYYQEKPKKKENKNNED